MSTTTTFYASGDGRVYTSQSAPYNQSTWDADHDATNGDVAEPDALGCGVYYRVTGTCYLFRGITPFDTSSIPNTATISAASAFLYGRDKSNNSFSEKFVAVESTCGTSGVAVADYSKCGATNNPTVLGDMAIASMTTTGYNEIALNASGVAIVSKTGFTKLAWRVEHDTQDIFYDSAGGAKYTEAAFWPSATAGTSQDPYLSVTYDRSLYDIEFDAATSASGSAWITASSTFNWSHTCTGDNRLLVVGVYGVDTDPGVTASVTYGGTAMTSIDTKTVSSGGSTDRVTLFYLANPASGANTVEVTFSGTADYAAAAAASYTGARQSAQPDSSATGNATNTSLTLTSTTVADKAWQVGIFRNNYVTGISRTGCTFRGGFAAGGVEVVDTAAPLTPAGSKSITETVGGSAKWIGVVASFAPAQAPPSGTSPLWFTM